MEILGIGLPELFFIVLLVLILLGPKDMVKAGRTLGRTLRGFLMSPLWQAMRTTGKELQALPTKLVREAGIEELQSLQREVQGLQQGFKDPLGQIKASKSIFDEKNLFAPPPRQETAPPANPPAASPEAPSANPPAE